MNKFKYIEKVSVSKEALRVLPATKGRALKFKRGGVIKSTENIIPNGVRHEEKNELGDKGMPVVSCGSSLKSCTKKYEIERDELIFTLASSSKVEKLIKAGKIEELGDFVKNQILHNTHSFTTKFNELNNYKDDSIFS